MTLAAGARPFHEGVGTIFHALNRNKRSVTVDLGNEEALARLRRLLVEDDRCADPEYAPRPGREARPWARRLLLADNPRLIHASIGAFGKQGPLGAAPGLRPADAGLRRHHVGDGRGGGGPAAGPRRHLADRYGLGHVGGDRRAVGALLRRAQTGKGGVVGASLFETALGWMVYHATAHAATGRDPTPQGSGSPYIVPYGAYRTADSMLIVTAGNNALFEKLLAVWSAIPNGLPMSRFATNGDRVRNRAAFDELLNAALSARTTAEWIPLIEAAGVPCAPIQTMGQVVAHPQTEALDITAAQRRWRADLLRPAFVLRQYPARAE